MDNRNVHFRHQSLHALLRHWDELVLYVFTFEVHAHLVLTFLKCTSWLWIPWLVKSASMISPHFTSDSIDLPPFLQGDKMCVLFEHSIFWQN